MTGRECDAVGRRFTRPWTSRKGTIWLALTFFSFWTGKATAQPGCAGAAGCPAQKYGSIDLPPAGSVQSGFVQVAGWAWTGKPVSGIDVYIDGTDEQFRVLPGGLRTKLPRPDVAALYPELVSSSFYPGFELVILATRLPDGEHTVFVRATDDAGCCLFLERTLLIDGGRLQPPIGKLEYPTPDQRIGFGILQAQGWALDDKRVDHVDLMVDGQLELQVTTALPRPDVAGDYLGIAAGANRSGFIGLLDATRYSTGPHEVSAVAVDQEGQKATVGSARILSEATSAIQPPFGEVESPLLNVTAVGNCSASPPTGSDIADTRMLLQVSGWALDSSPSRGKAGLATVTVEIDGVQLRDARTDCRREPRLGNRRVNCYGVYRPDITNYLGGIDPCPRCGFSFLIDPGYLLSRQGFREGAHVMQVKAVDLDENVTLLRELPMVLECATSAFDPQPVCGVDIPAAYSTIRGTVEVVGWAVDLDSVKDVRLLIDGIPQIDVIRGTDKAEYGLPSLDVAAQYPDYPKSSEARWRLQIDTRRLSNSEHDLLVEVRDGRDNVRACSTRRLLVNNNALGAY